jgi:hypothetical protein
MTTFYGKERRDEAEVLSARSCFDELSSNGAVEACPELVEAGIPLRTFPDATPYRRASHFHSRISGISSPYFSM